MMLFCKLHGENFLTFLIHLFAAYLVILSASDSKVSIDTMWKEGDIV